MKHKVFISYHHADDTVVGKFIDKFAKINNIFTPKIVGENYDTSINSDNPEYTMRVIRERYLTDSTVTIVLIGKDTYKRKYVDWEIASTLRNDYYNKRSGLIGIFLPGCNKYNTIVPYRLDDNLKNSYARCYDYSECTPSNLKRWIDEAYDKRNNFNYGVNNSRTLFINNRN